MLDLVSDPGLFWPQRHRSATQRMHDQLWKCPPVQPARSSGLRQEHGLLWRIVPGQKDIQRVRKIPAYLSTSTLNSVLYRLSVRLLIPIFTYILRKGEEVCFQQEDLVVNIHMYALGFIYWFKIDYSVVTMLKF